MNPADGNPGINALARTIQGQILRNREADSALILDFGTIQGDMSLLTNTYPLPIPKSDYLICRQLSLGPAGAVLTQTKEEQGQHEHTENEGAPKHKHPDTEGDHIHDALVPPTMRSLAPGDRVLVAWVGRDAVVIDLILPG